MFIYRIIKIYSSYYQIVLFDFFYSDFMLLLYLLGKLNDVIVVSLWEHVNVIV